MADQLRLVTVVGPTSGGIGRHVHAVVARLVELGHRVTVVGPPVTEELFEWSKTGAQFMAAPVGATSMSALRAAVHALRPAAGSADVVHAHGARAGATAGLARVHPLVVTWHNSRPARWRRRIGHPVVELVAARAADLTLAVSPDLLDRAGRAGARHRLLVPAAAPVMVQPTASRSEVRASLGVGERPLVLAVARLEPQKRLDVLVDATAGWQHRDDRPVVAVAGAGSQAAALERRASAVDSPLLLLGRRHDVADLLAAADVAVLSSDWEGYPLAAQEALRLGVPLVATAVGGVPGLVGGAAVLVPPGDPAALGAALATLLADEQQRRRLSAAGRTRAQQWPTLAETVDELVATYRDLKST
jgi:glycosyltransferase involved in cell wall biosynthesis